MTLLSMLSLYYLPFFGLGASVKETRNQGAERGSFSGRVRCPYYILFGLDASAHISLHSIDHLHPRQRCWKC
jgi:hypothetical protein